MARNDYTSIACIMLVDPSAFWLYALPGQGQTSRPSRLVTKAAAMIINTAYDLAASEIVHTLLQATVYMVRIIRAIESCHHDRHLLHLPEVVKRL